MHARKLVQQPYGIVVLAHVLNAQRCVVDGPRVKSAVNFEKLCQIMNAALSQAYESEDFRFVCSAVLFLFF